MLAKPNRDRASPGPMHNGHHSGHHSQQHHVFRGTTSRHQGKPAGHAVHPGVPHIDGSLSDAADVLARVRGMLRGQRASAVVTVDESPAALFDLFSVMLLLDEDVKEDEPSTCVLFQPVLDLRAKLSAMQALGQLEAGPIDHHAHAAHGAHPTRVHPASAASHGTHGHGHGHSHSPVHSDHHQAHHAHAPSTVAALITKARCPKLLAQQPATCIVASVHKDCAELAGLLAATARAHGSTKLRCAPSPEGLVAAYRVLRAARSLVRAQGAADILVMPGYELAAAAGAGGAQGQRSSAGSGSSSGGGGSYDGVMEYSGEDMVLPVGTTLNNIVRAPQPAQAASTAAPASARPDHDHAVLYFNIWVRPREAS